MTTQQYTDIELGKVANFAHRSSLFQEALREGDFSSCLELATEGESHE